MGCSSGTMAAGDQSVQRGDQSGYGYQNQTNHQQPSQTMYYQEPHNQHQDFTNQSGYGYQNQTNHQQPSQTIYYQEPHNQQHQDFTNQQHSQQGQNFLLNGNLEEQVAASRVLLDNEDKDSMRGRLSLYGTFASSYTLREMLDYNSKHSNPWEMLLFPYHKKVVSAEAMKDLVRPEVKKVEQDFLQEASPYEKENFIPHDFKWFVPIFQLSHIGMKIALIKRYAEKCIVADLSGTKEEYWSDVRQDVLTVVSEIDRSPEIMFSAQYLQELKEVYQRFLEKYDRTNGFPDSRDPVSGDPNQATFPLDHPFSEHPELLRAWAETWEKFDTEVPTKEWDPWYFKEKFEDIPKPEEVLIRSYSDDLPPFNHEIDGEAAWEVIEVDLLKNDITTPQQDDVWKSRESHPDWADPKRMERRRRKIEQYYIEKYEWPESKLEPYRGFCDRLQESWDRFQGLCTE